MGFLPAETTTRRALVAVLFAVGIFFRAYALDRIPLPIYQDALSNVYDAYSIVETGADRWGSPHPIIVRAFGENDFRPAMMVWLTTLPVKVLGFSTVAARVPSAILGCISLFLIFALARRMAGPVFATVALAFAALSPWLISDARVGHEGASLAPLFVILILYLWHRAAERKYALSWTLLVGFVTGFSSSAYQTTRLIGPLLLVMMLIDALLTRRKADRVTVALIGSALIGAAPQISVFVTGRDRFFARAAETVVSGSGPIDTTLEILSGFAANFAPRYLFWPDMTEAFLTTARLLPVEVLFLPLGLLTLARMGGWTLPRFRWYLYAALVIAVLPAALTNQNPHSLRAASAAVLFPFFSAAGILAIYRWAQSRPGWDASVRLLVPASVAGSFVFVLYMYVEGRAVRGLRMQNAMVQAATKVDRYDERYEKVFIADHGLYPYLYYVAFTGMTPVQFQKAPKQIYSLRGWDVVRRVGKFYFRTDSELVKEARQSTMPSGRNLFVSREPLEGSRVIDSVALHWDKYYIADFPSKGSALIATPVARH